jgi:hypothetical protein
MRSSFVLLLLFLALFIPQIVHSQTDSCSRRIVPVSVLTADGKSVTGLQTINFEAWLRGTPVQVVSVKPYDKSPRIVIVIDVSASMTAESEIWPLYVGMADHLVTNLPPGASVALVVFASHIERTVPLTEDKATLRAELKSLKNIGQVLPRKEQQTALWEAVQNAAELLGPPELGDAIYALTDAGNTYGKATLRSARDSLRSKGIRLFWFFVEVPPGGSTPEEYAGPVDFADVVSDTGGVEVNVLRSKLNHDFPFVDENGRETEIGLRLLKQYRLMLHIYRMEIGFPTPLQKGARWQLKVKVPNADKLGLDYPPKLSDCAVPLSDPSATH